MREGETKTTIVMKRSIQNLIWQLDREVWAHVPDGGQSEPWTQSKAREETKRRILDWLEDNGISLDRPKYQIILTNTDGQEVATIECSTHTSFVHLTELHQQGKLFNGTKIKIV